MAVAISQVKLKKSESLKSTETPTYGGLTSGDASRLARSPPTIFPASDLDSKDLRMLRSLTKSDSTGSVSLTEDSMS